MAHSNRPSKRAIPGLRPAYPANLLERMAAVAYTEAYLNRKREKRANHMKQTRKSR